MSPINADKRSAHKANKVERRLCFQGLVWRENCFSIAFLVFFLTSMSLLLKIVMQKCEHQCSLFVFLYYVKRNLICTFCQYSWVKQAFVCIVFAGRKLNMRVNAVLSLTSGRMKIILLMYTCLKVIDALYFILIKTYAMYAT